MTDPAQYIEEMTESGEHIAKFSGNWSLAHLGDIDAQLRAADGPSILDISAITRMDTIGAWLIYRTQTQLNASILGASDDAQKLLKQMASQQIEIADDRYKSSRFVQILNDIGFGVVDALRTLLQFIGFIGEVVLSFLYSLRHPSRFRLNALVSHFENVGLKALGIIGLMSFLIGIVIAQQGAVQLRQFGAEIFTVNLIGRITFRELGVLMTAIMVAGRSGSAFAAEIGTMKITEEVDAMRTIGVSPIEALVIPRTLATFIMMPLLGFYASIVAVTGGGLLCWIILDIPPAAYVQKIREVTPMTDFWVGMIKAPIFGAIIAMTGCFHGLQVKSNTEEVGRRTTAAVVQAIFLVIVLDAFFAVFFSSIGWD
ncbi:ABC transporter permease [Sphingorhabdus lutea]|uniref:ABC transporter permease n=1 Tax=Sphingorhabdus lutea TaxID=1913578 RepID=A0A1L3JB19_9SPHN|nr:ABC transporter permease [Sphingorhabdus lutea]APG62318.1 ABC transporter permease [Sphingorhabdus lutea]